MRLPCSLGTAVPCACRGPWALGCFFGEEWYAQWEEAANYLLELSEQHEYAWPADAIFGVWAELWNRWCEELREIDQRVLHELREEAPPYDRIRFFPTAPGANGTPWLRLPRTFDLEGPDEYFQRDVMGRQTRALNRACWGATLRKAPASSEPRKAGADSAPTADCPAAGRQKNGGRDTKVVGSTAPAQEGAPLARPFIGPTLTQEECARAMAHAPKTHDGSRALCWDAGTHRGCPNQECRNAHGKLGKHHLLDPAVQMEIVRRGGFKEEKKLEAPQAAQRIDTLRKGIFKKAASDRNPPHKAGGGPPGPTTAGPTVTAPASTPKVVPTPVIEEVSTGPLTKAATVSAGVKVGLGPPPSVGRRPTPPQEDEDNGEGPPRILRISLEFPDPDDPETEGAPPTMSAAPWKINLPPDLRDALPTALEHSMTDLVNGPDTSWVEDVKVGQGRPRPIGAPSDDEETKRATLMSTSEADPALAAYRVPGLLGVYLHNRWPQEHLNPTASATAANLLDHYLGEAVDHAGPELATAAAQALANLPDPLDRHADSGHAYEPETGQRIVVGPVHWASQDRAGLVGMGQVEWAGAVWGTRDYQASLALNDELQSVLINEPEDPSRPHLEDRQ